MCYCEHLSCRADSLTKHNIMPTSRNNRKNKKKKKKHPNPQKRSNMVDRMTEHFKRQSVLAELGEKTPHKDKVPELIMEFIKDELEARTEQDEQREIINAGIACWNIGSFGEPSDMEQRLEETMNTVSADEKLRQTMRNLFERKVKEYSQYKYFITDYDIKRTVIGTWDLTISSFDFTQLAAIKDGLKN